MKQPLRSVHVLSCFCLLSSLSLGGCGQKGDLYLPSDPQADVRQQAPKAIDETIRERASGVVIDAQPEARKIDLKKDESGRKAPADAQEKPE